MPRHIPYYFSLRTQRGIYSNRRAGIEAAAPFVRFFNSDPSYPIKEAEAVPQRDRGHCENEIKYGKVGPRGRRGRKRNRPNLMSPSHECV